MRQKKRGTSAPEVKDGGLRIGKAAERPHQYTLEELLANTDEAIGRNDDDEIWLNSEPVGREIL